MTISRDKFAVAKALACLDANAIKKASRDFYMYKIPVCSGIQGIGKTSVLQQCVEQAVTRKDEGSCACAVFGCSNTDTDMPIEALVSWQLLYEFLVHGVCSGSMANFLEALPEWKCDLK